MKKKILTLALVGALAVSSLSVSMASSSSTNTRTTPTSGTHGSSSSSSSSSSTSGSSATAAATANGTSVKSIQVGDTTVSQASQTAADGSVVTFLNTKLGMDAGLTNGVAGTILVITKNGVSIGCVVDPTTGRPLATGADTIYYAYDANGQVVAHYVDANGYFYVGTRVVNGVAHTFNADGTMIA